MRGLPAIFALVCFSLGGAPVSWAAEKGYTAAERSHWSLQQRTRPAIPQLTDPAEGAWIRNPIDALILTRLKKEGLRPAPEADRRTLLRRLSYDLTGLPPSPAEIQQVLADPSPRAYETLIERLLASPHYGERWGQHWLDVVHYGETEGFEYDRLRPDLWRYRDYVIGAFNSDKPYDQFITEQVAGDEMEDIGPDLGARIAAGLHRLGPVRRNAGNTIVAFSRNEVLTEMTDMMGAAFLGLTLGCARCHDHMFDPIRQKDYYRLQAFLAATHEHDLSLVAPEVVAQWKKRNDAVTAELARIEKALGSATGEAQRQLEEKRKDAERRLPPPPAALCTVHHSEDQRTPIHVLKRGDETKQGEPVGMRVLGVLLADGTPELPPDTRKPKTLLARWLTDPSHPLVARVIVNRIWLNHFGQGIVATPNDFGNNGSPPSHPELLDYLADELIRNGWRIKPLQRLILSSSTYRQAARSPDAQLSMAKDPDNRLLGRFSRRRLDAEQIRDSLLAISGQLNRKAGGPSVLVPVDAELVNLLYKPSQWAVTPNREEHGCRSVYLIAKRNLRVPFLDVFDQPDLQTSCARRVASTHAPQALELLNGTLSNELAEAFAQRLQREAGPDPGQQVEHAFWLALGRPPSHAERQVACTFLESQPLREFALALFNLNDLLYVD